MTCKPVVEKWEGELQPLIADRRQLVCSCVEQRLPGSSAVVNFSHRWATYVVSSPCSQIRECTLCGSAHDAGRQIFWWLQPLSHFMSRLEGAQETHAATPPLQCGMQILCRAPGTIRRMFCGRWSPHKCQGCFGGGLRSVVASYATSASARDNLPVQGIRL